MNTGVNFAKLRDMETKAFKGSNLLTIGLLGVTLYGPLAAFGQSKAYFSDNPKTTIQMNSSSVAKGSQLKSLEQKTGSIGLEKLIEKQIRIDQQKEYGINGLKLRGGDSSGGGNPEEVAFIREALQIHQWLQMNPSKLKTEFGFELNLFTQSIDVTRISCAPEPYLNYMRSLSKKAYFIGGLKTVFLDCDKFDQMKTDQSLFRSVVFHEYMRSAGLEGEDVYKYSSRIQELVTRIWKEAHTPTPGIYGSEGSRNEIIVGYSGGTMVLISNFFYGNDKFQVKMELKETQPGKWVAEGQIEQRASVRYCTYPVKIEFVPLTGYTKPVADVKTTLPVNLPDYLEEGCPQPPQKTRVENPYVKIQDL